MSAYRVGAVTTVPFLIVRSKSGMGLGGSRPSDYLRFPAIYCRRIIQLELGHAVARSSTRHSSSQLLSTVGRALPVSR
jgi:hypothetical protein